MSDILFVLSGLLLGLAFKGGMWLFLIPFAGVACALAFMNRPRLPGGKTANIPVVTKAIRATGLVPATTPDLRSEYNDVKQVEVKKVEEEKKMEEKKESEPKALKAVKK